MSSKTSRKRGNGAHRSQEFQGVQRLGGPATGLRRQQGKAEEDRGEEHRVGEAVPYLAPPGALGGPLVVHTGFEEASGRE